MKILVTGTEGYIGTRLAPLLIADGHEVVGLDTGYYRDGWLYSPTPQPYITPRLLNKDLRSVVPDDVEGFDAVVHLAELSNDPLGENKPEVTYRINHEGSVNLARMAKAAGVSRFVYASSCSVYGLGVGDWLDETSPVNPQTAYAKCKVMVERDVKPMGDSSFCATFLRNATAYGASPRMRFDIVINDLCGLAWTKKRIAMTSDGSPWRPVVHVEDICLAIRLTLGAPPSTVNGEAFNVGSNAENYRVREIAQTIASVFPGCEVSTGSSSGDNRSYRVKFDKIRKHLPTFETQWSALKGAQELRTLFERIEMSSDTFGYRAFTRLKQLRYLSHTGQIDDEFRWSEARNLAARPV
jgi:nucleoside-diphosphate-sugar epimerase